LGLFLIINNENGGVVVNSRKRIITVFTIIGILLFTATCFAQGLEIPDKLVSEAIEYLESFHFDSCKHLNSADRYQVSLELANIIQRLELNSDSRIQRFGVSRKINLQEIISNYNRRVLNEQRLSEENISALILLAKQYQQELNVLGYDIQDFNQQVSAGAEEYMPTANLDLLKTKDAYIADSDLQREQILMINSSGLKHPAVAAETQYNEQYFTIGQLNKKFRTPYGDQDDDEIPELVINNLIPLWSDLYLGAGVVLTQNDEEKNSGYAGLAGEYKLGKDIVLEGQYFHNLSQPLKTGILQLGARVRLGNVELGGLILTPESKPTTTSLDLTYGIPNSFSVRAGAGYQADSDLKTISELGNPVSTSLDVDIPISQGRIVIGLLQEWNQEKEDEDGSDEHNDTITASLGFSYELDKAAFIELDYSLINFSSIDTNAKFSIRF